MKKTLCGMLLFGLLFVIILTGCSGGGSGSGATNKPAGTGTTTNTSTSVGKSSPTVLSKSTDGSSCAVDPGATISVTFNNDMIASSITASTFTLQQDGATVTGTVTYESSTKTAAFKPASPLANGALHTATITIDVMDTASTAMAKSFTWSFTTKAGAPLLMGGAIQGNSLNLSNIVTTIAGTAGSPGSTDGTGSSSRFKQPTDITSDGPNLYVTDRGNNTIRKIVISTGVVTTIAGTAGPSGSTDGTGAAASFNNPSGITTATDGANLYVADTNNHTIRKIVIATGAVTTIAGTAGSSGSTDDTGAAARFNFPYSITTDGTNLYVTETNSNYTIRKIVIATGTVTTLTLTVGGTPIGSSYGLSGITTDGNNIFYVLGSYFDSQRNIPIYMIYKWDLSTGTDTYLAGGQSGSGVTTFSQPYGITTDGTNLFIADHGYNTIYNDAAVIAGTTGSSGSTDGLGSAASFNSPYGITTDGTNLYVADTNNHTIRRISAKTSAPSSPPGTVIASAGNGQITITWNGVSDANCYNLYCAAGTSVTETAGTEIASVASPYTYTGLTNGTTYACIETAVNNFGEGPPASPILLTPAASHTLSVSKSGTGSGTVSSSPSGIDCGATCTASMTNGTTVTLTATAASGSTFGGWSGGGCSGTGSCTVTMDSDKTVTATFTVSTTPPPPPTTGGTYYWANWSCSSSQCASVMGASNGSTGQFCTLADCNACATSGCIGIFGASCSTTATYAKRIVTAADGVCLRSGVDF